MTHNNGNTVPELVSENSSLSQPTPPTWSEVHDLILKTNLADNTISSKRGLEFMINPFSSWRASGEVMQKDHAVVRTCVDELVELMGKVKENRKFEVQNLSLAAKNRAELLSQKSDFYPVGITFCVAILALLAMIPPKSELWVKSAFLILSALTTFSYGLSRFKSRAQVADLKMVANILDIVEKRL